jgi:hypothetical protein
MLLRRVFKEMEDLVAHGFRPVGGDTLKQAFVERPAQFNKGGARGELTARQVMRLVLPDTLVQKAIIDPINYHLKQRFDNCGTGEKSRYGPLALEEWWKYFTKQLATRLLKKGKAAELTDADLAYADGLVHPHRFTALNGAHIFTEVEISTLQEALRSNLRTIVALGNYAVVDETVYAHTGHQMRVDGNSILIPGKPHPYGLLAYSLVQALLHSGCPILVDFEPRLPDARMSGPVALRVLVARSFPKLDTQLHVYADSLFSGTTQISEFRRTGVKVTISFGGNAETPLRALRSAVIPDLASASSTTFAVPSAIVQITTGDKHPPA